MARNFVRAVAAAMIVAWFGLPAHAKYAATDTIGDWVVYCDSEDADKCLANQTIWMVQDDVRQKVVSSSVSRNDESWQMALTLPLGVNLPFGAILRVDQGPQFKAPYLRCDTSGCVVLVDLNDELYDALKKGNTLTVGFKSSLSEQPLAVKLSLQGFTKATGRLVTQ